MTAHTNEPPEPVTPGPEPDDVPQPDQNEVELPPREDRAPASSDICLYGTLTHAVGQQTCGGFIENDFRPGMPFQYS